MAFHVPVKPELITWAIERSGKDQFHLERNFPKLQTWLDGTGEPTFKQLERFAHTTYTSVAHLISDRPPEENLPIPDFRTIANRQVPGPSANLLDTIYICQQRQVWYQEYLQIEGAPELAFPGSVSIRDSVESVAGKISREISFNVAERARLNTGEIALNQFITQVEECGVLVMRSGIVGNNTRRTLDVAEFRGFALVDRHAPLIFINGNDAKAAQMFTLAHELAHIWLGETGLSNAQLRGNEQTRAEQWCNAVAAELLVPINDLKAVLIPDEPLDTTLKRLSRQFKVSALVLLRRLLDAKILTRAQFSEHFNQEASRFERKVPGGGGDFYRIQLRRISPVFARAIIASALEGRTSFRDAGLLTGVRKNATFYEMGHRLGVIV